MQRRIGIAVNRIGTDIQNMRRMRAGQPVIDFGLHDDVVAKHRVILAGGQCCCDDHRVTGTDQSRELGPTARLKQVHVIAGQAEAIHALFLKRIGDRSADKAPGTNDNSAFRAAASGIKMNN